LLLTTYDKAKAGQRRVPARPAGLEMERFLPGGLPAALERRHGGMLREFRDWLTNRSPQSYLALGLRLAEYYNENGARMARSGFSTGSGR